ncbi:hypothetical protein ACA910_003098 [Epithemia clementina (nom. ined.)]
MLDQVPEQGARPRASSHSSHSAEGAISSCPFHSPKTISDDKNICNGEQQLQELWQGLVNKAEARKQSSATTSEPGAPPASSSSAAVTGDFPCVDDDKNNKNKDHNQRHWPSYDAVMSSVLNADYNEILTCPMDTTERTEGKVLCAHGVVCQARLELFPSAPSSSSTTTTTSPPPYTGMLAPGSKWENCLLRLSSAMQPPSQAITTAWARGILFTTGDKVRNAKLYPCSALKVFPNTPNNQNDRRSCNNSSRNILFGGSKVGQRETDFFAHCQCTSMTERMPRAVKPFVKKFWQYSKWPLSLGISDFCKPFSVEQQQKSSNVKSNNNNNDDGKDEQCSSINFPFALILKPRIRSEGDNTALTPNEEGDDDDSASGDDTETSSSSKSGSSGWSKLLSFGSSRPEYSSKASSSVSTSTTTDSDKVNSFDSFLDFALHGIPAGTHLFDVYACPTPFDVADASKLQRIGKIVCTSTFLESTPRDGLFFKHQAKEEDYALRPDWPQALAQPVTVDDGKIKGTIGTLAGWKLFEQQIGKKQYQDYERLEKD